MQRKGALRVGCAYRTVSEAAILVLAGIITTDLLVGESKRVYDAKQRGESRGVKKLVREIVHYPSRRKCRSKSLRVGGLPGS